MSAILDALGFVGDAIGRPGQAVRGLLAGRTDQLARLIPGAESMGLVGEGDATSGQDLLDKWGLMNKDDSWANWGAGLATEIATDPLTYAGGLLGSKAGQALFNKVGPRHGGDISKVANFKGMMRPEGAELADDIIKAGGSAAMHEIPQGSQFLGSGAEALAFRTPQGDVVRLGMHRPNAAIGVPDVEGVLQPTRRVVKGGVEVTRAPFADDVGKVPWDEIKGLQSNLNTQGVDFYDLSRANVGRVGGRPTVIDPGAYDVMDLPFKEFAGQATGRFRYGGMGAGVAPSALSQMLGG